MISRSNTWLVVSAVVGLAPLPLACSDGGGSGRFIGDAGAAGSGNNPPVTPGSPPSSSTPSGSTPGLDATAPASGPVGCHAACKCYEPPYAPSEIDCSGSCQKLASWSADSICKGFAGDNGIDDCIRRCNGIAQTWTQPNVATVMASQIFGCATISSSCTATTSCVQAYTDQQKTVCQH